MATSAPPVPSETGSSLSESQGVVKRPLPAKAEEVEDSGAKKSGAAQEGLRVAMRAELGGLTETLTLRIFAELDLRSLGAVKRVSRRLGRIAEDESLLRRVTNVRWDDKYKGFQTNCTQLGVKWNDYPANAEKFLGILAGLLEGGTKLASLQLPRCEKFTASCSVGSPRLGALLAKPCVRLKALSCSGGLAELLDIVRSQPGLDHLRLHGMDSRLAKELAKHGPNIRHLDFACSFPEKARSAAALVPQLRSFVVLECRLEEVRAVVGSGAGGGKLLFHAAGGGARLRSRFPTYRAMALAVGDFRREERGSNFLRNGKPWDAWDEADRPILPKPTDDLCHIKAFLAKLT